MPGEGSGMFVTMKTGQVTPGIGSGRIGYQGNSKCDPRYKIWEGCHQRDCGHVTPGAGTLKGSPWRLWTCDPRCRFWGEVSH